MTVTPAGFLVLVGLMLLASPFLVEAHMDWLNDRDKRRKAEAQLAANAAAQTAQLPAVERPTTHRASRHHRATVAVPSVHSSGGWRPQHSGRHAVDAPTAAITRVGAVA